MNRAIFKPTEPGEDSNGLNVEDRFGSPCTVVRPLTSEEVDIEEVGPMHKIRFDDGTITDAFANELEKITVREFEIIINDDPWISGLTELDLRNLQDMISCVLRNKTESEVTMLDGHAGSIGIVEVEPSEE